MNYFAHGRAFLDNPYFLAGTALPDWLSVVDRRTKLRPEQARSFAHDADPQIAALAAGVIRHHDDDRWFHVTPAFAELSLHLASLSRKVLPDDESMRPGFLGHVLVEVLLDSELIAEDPGRLDDYYRAMSAVNPAVVSDNVRLMTAKPVERLVEFIPLFISERFLSDYADDAKLCVRLNQVMLRVGLPELPADFQRIIPEARRHVAGRKHELLDKNEAT